MHNRELLFRYLLGDLPSDERQRMQEDAATNNAVRENLREAESDLIDCYVCQRLSERQRSQFENYFLDSDQKHERVEMSQILLSSAVRRIAPAPKFEEFAHDSQSPPIKVASSPWSWLSSIRLGLAMATLVLAIATTVVAVQNFRLRDELDRSESEAMNSRNQISELKNQIAQLHGSANGKASDLAGMGPRTEVSLVLSPGQERSSDGTNGTPLLKLSPPPVVVLTLELERDRYPAYDVNVTTAAGEQIWHKGSLKSQPGSQGGHVIVARLPSDLLAAGDYFIRVSARTSGREQRNIDEYAFTVSSR